MNYDTAVYWDKGTVRSVNQDSLILLQTLTCRGRVLLAAVCDGMGGMDCGEDASGYLVEELVRWFYDGLLSSVGKKKPLWVIRRSAERKIYQVQRRIQRYADKKKLEMGTTLSMIVLWEKSYLLWHLGDSRIYRLGRGKKAKTHLLTKDHVRGADRLTKCVGSFGYFAPDFRMGSVKKGEAFLVCSDGFWRKTDSAEIQGVLAPEQMTKEKSERRLQEMAQALMRRGERDNLSAVYIKVEEGRRLHGSS